MPATASRDQLDGRGSRADATLPAGGRAIGKRKQKPRPSDPPPAANAPVPEAEPPRPRRRSMLRRLVSLVGAYLVFELLALATLAALQSGAGLRFETAPTHLWPAMRARIEGYLAGDHETLTAHPVLGWQPAAGCNSLGARDDLEYPRQAAPAVLRIAAFGGSYTYGEGVPLPQTWSKLLSFEVPRLEVLNFGVPGYGLDQAYLRYLDRAEAAAAQLVFVALSPDCFVRNVSVFPAFAGPSEPDIFSKPRFLEGGRLRANPLRQRGDFERLLRDDSAMLRELGADDFVYQASLQAGSFDVLPSLRLLKLVNRRLFRLHEPVFQPDGLLNPTSEAWRVTTELLDRVYIDVLQRGSLPIILIFPESQDTARESAGKPCRYQILLDWASARGYAVIDLLQALKPWQERQRHDALRDRAGMFTPQGNRVLAAGIGENLQRWGFLSQPDAVASAIAFERKRLE